MQLIDIIRHMGTSQRIMIGDYHNKSSQKEFKNSQVMKLGNIPWEKLRHWEYRNVYAIVPHVDKQGNAYLYIAVDDSEKDFYKRGR